MIPFLVVVSGLGVAVDVPGSMVETTAVEGSVGHSD